MNKKIKPDSNGFVFSTDPNFRFEEADHIPQETIAPAKQQLRVRLDTKHRAGKAVTLVTGFIGTTEDLDALGKKIKNHCGTGGSIKDGAVIIQGDQRDKVMQWLNKNGYAATKRV